MEEMMSCADCGFIFNSDDHPPKCPHCEGGNIRIHNEDGDEWAR